MVCLSDQNPLALFLSNALAGISGNRLAITAKYMLLYRAQVLQVNHTLQVAITLPEFDDVSHEKLYLLDQSPLKSHSVHTRAWANTAKWDLWLCLAVVVIRYVRYLC